MRTLLIAGNWKMNPTTTEAAVALAEAVKSGRRARRPTSTSPSARPSSSSSRIDQVLEGSPIGLGGQNMYWEAAGAFTGEISGRDAGRRRLHPRDPGPQRAAARHGRDRRPGQHASSRPPWTPS